MGQDGEPPGIFVWGIGILKPGCDGFCNPITDGQRRECATIKQNRIRAD